MRDVRVVRAERVLSSHGLSTDASITGQSEDIIAVRAPFEQLRHLREIAPELKELGFRYVALELKTADDLDGAKRDA